MTKLKYVNYDVVFQEVPNEVTLCFSISGCPYRCRGCHSKYLWEYIGDYLSDNIDDIIKKYNGMITCVCFMGGDQNLTELEDLLCKVKYTYELKTCVYSGSDDIAIFNNLLQHLDYLKIGRYIEELGGLKKSTTNQRFYRIGSDELIDITEMFN